MGGPSDLAPWVAVGVVAFAAAFGLAPLIHRRCAPSMRERRMESAALGVRDLPVHFSLNEGATVGFAAFGESDEFGALPPEPAALLARLRGTPERNGTIAAAWSATDESTRQRLGDASGCLDRLESFLLQASRMAGYANALQRRPFYVPGAAPGTEIPPGAMAACAWTAAGADFESLLFHGRAALDRLTLFVAAEHKQDCDDPKKLPNLLGNFEKKDERARHVRGLFNGVKGLDRVLLSGPDGKSLRSRFIHRGGVAEDADMVFAVNRLRDGRFLILDYEALGYPVLATARSLACEVPYLVLNTVATYVGEEGSLPLSAFDPPWRNPTVAHRTYLDPTVSGPQFSTVRMMPDGFRFSEVSLRQEVFERAEPA